MFPTADDENSPPTVINTITLDDKASAADLQRMAANSGGQYVHVTSGK
jgi:hypothetical protein